MEWSFISISCLIILPLHLVTCNGEDRITAGASLSINRTITSSNNIFRLGFFIPINSTNRNYYLGIWYNKIPIQSIVWVANKENPLKDSSGFLTITQDGNLAVFNGNRNILWSSNVSSLVENSTMAVLVDAGDLVLRKKDDQTIVWQSFDDPFGSFIPGMELLLNLKTGKNRRAISWKDVNDPTPGPYSCGIDPHTPRQLVVWNGSDVYARSTIWHRVLDGIMPEATAGYDYIGYVSFMATDEKVGMKFTVSSTSFMPRFVFNPTGQIQLQSWQDISSQWLILMTLPSSVCDFYARCGPFASCEDNSTSPLCRCLKEYKPKNPQAWNLGNWSEGCARPKPFGCGSKDKFFRLEKMKLPDFSLSMGNVSARDCELECLNNCSCTAYAYSNVSNWGNCKCLIWVGDLIDLVENRELDVDLYLRVTGSEIGINFSNKRRRFLSILLSLAATLMLLVIGYFMWSRHKKNGWRAQNGGSRLRDWVNQCKDFNMLQSDKNISELHLISFDSIATATNNFSLTNKLGAGGFGPVYKGKLPTGQEIAVKTLSKSSHQGLEEFKNEVEVIAKLQHKNLVKLLGWCIHGEEKMLIYEYMPNSSLDKFLFVDVLDSQVKVAFDILTREYSGRGVLKSHFHYPNKQSLLDWGKRFRIVEGIAQGILYLHQYSRVKVIHRDLKASNILLDLELNPKISDFGLARIFGGNQTEANTNKVAGTYGYMSPEYAMRGLFSEKSDVFSFGVLLLEIVTCKQSTRFYPDKTWLNLQGLVWQLWIEGKGLESMDPSISSSCVPYQVDRCVHVGLLCVQEDPTDRPTMSSVVSMLGNASIKPPSPKKPAFSMWKSPIPIKASANNSIDEEMITTVEART